MRMQKKIFMVLMVLAVPATLVSYPVKLTPQGAPIEAVFHEYGFNFALPQPMSADAKPWIITAEVVTALLRAGLLPLAESIKNDVSAGAELKKALISFISLSNGILHIANQSFSDHTIDAAWAVTDSVQTVKHLFSALDSVLKPHDNYSALLTTEEKQPPLSLVFKYGIAFECLLGVASALFPENATRNGRVERRTDFIMRSAFSMLRLMRNYADSSAFNGEKNLYALLMAAQLAYTAGKCYKQPFAAPRAIPAQINNNPPVPDQVPGPVPPAGNIIFNDYPGGPTAADEAQLNAPGAVGLHFGVAHEVVRQEAGVVREMRRVFGVRRDDQDAAFSCSLCMNAWAVEGAVSQEAGQNLALTHLPCGHTFCTECINNHFASGIIQAAAEFVPDGGFILFGQARPERGLRRDCPECRAHADPADVQRLVVNFANRTIQLA